MTLDKRISECKEQLENLSYKFQNQEKEGEEYDLMAEQMEELERELTHLFDFIKTIKPIHGKPQSNRSLKFDSKKVNDSDDVFNPDELALEERKLVQEREELKAQEKELMEEMILIIKEQGNIEKRAQTFMLKIYELDTKCLYLLENNEDKIRSIENMNTELKRLSKIFLLGELFDIEIDRVPRTDKAPIISKLHVFSPEFKNINWEETNAGLGHILLLTHHLCTKNNIKLANIELVPKGNSSYLQITDSGQKLHKCEFWGPHKNEVVLS